MGKMSKEQIIAFAKDFASRILESSWPWWELDEEVVRVSDITISLGYLVRLAEAESEGYGEEYKKFYAYPEGWHESEDRLEEIIPRVAEDEEIEAVIFCEGELWEALYYYEAYGRNDEETKAVYKAFIEAVEKHGMWYEWGSGIIFLYQLS